MDEESESLDQLTGLNPGPPPIKKSDTRDSISSMDSDVSLSNRRRGSRDEEADQSDNGSSDCERPSRDLQVEPEAARRDKTVKDDVDSNTPDDDFTPPDNELADKICSQVEFYFADENIVKDAFLLKHVKRNKEGYVSLKLISSFKRVKHLCRDWRVVRAALARSVKLEVNPQGTKLRRIDPLPQFDQTTPSRTILAARLPVDRLSVETVAEIFRPCGEIALIRVLRSGHPAPAEVRQAIARRTELASCDEWAMVEFVDSASARAATRMELGDARIFELRQSGDKRKKQQQQQQQTRTGKTQTSKIVRDEFNPSGCMGSASGSENEEARLHGKHVRYPLYHHPYQGHPYQAGPPSPEAWLPRRLSSCSISGSESGYLMRRLSSCSSSSESGFGFGFGRRYSACSSGSDGGYYHPAYSSGFCQPASRRFSCCSNSGSECGMTCCGPSSRRGSTDCAPFARRLSTCSRDSGYEGSGPRRLSLNSSSGGEREFHRPRSNSGIALTHLPENVTRLPSGPDGTKGFGRPNRLASLRMEPAC